MQSRRIRFSLKKLFLATTIVASVFGLCAVVVRWHLTNQREHDGIIAIGSFGGTYSLESAVRSRRTGKAPNRFWRFLFNRVYHVDLSSDAWPLKENPFGQRYPAITDDDLVTLQNFASLRELDLDGANISDRAIEHLQRLAELEHVDITKTNITDEGVKQLRAALPVCKIKR